jgi:hypothetical protein
MKCWKLFWSAVIVATIFSVQAFAQDKQSIEKNLPDEFYGEWCFAAPDDPQAGTNYQLPSWAEKCDKEKILSISREGFAAGETSCHPISKIKVKVECAHSGCDTSATFKAECSRAVAGTNRNWSADFEIRRYKGNLYLKGHFQ